ESVNWVPDSLAVPTSSSSDDGYCWARYARMSCSTVGFSDSNDGRIPADMKVEKSAASRLSLESMTCSVLRLSNWKVNTIIAANTAAVMRVMPRVMRSRAECHQRIGAAVRIEAFTSVPGGRRQS